MHTNAHIKTHIQSSLLFSTSFLHITDREEKHWTHSRHLAGNGSRVDRVKACGPWLGKHLRHLQAQQIQNSYQNHLQHRVFHLSILSTHVSRLILRVPCVFALQLRDLKDQKGCPDNTCQWMKWKKKGSWQGKGGRIVIQLHRGIQN